MTLSKFGDGDILAVSSEFLATSDGRVVRLNMIAANPDAKELAEGYRVDEGLCELVLRELDEVMGGASEFLLKIQEGLLTLSTGIDKPTPDMEW